MNDKEGDQVIVRQPKILIVDDEPFNVDYLEQELEDLGYVTVSASNGQEALDQVAAELPDMILLDIMMPVMDGFEALARLKENKRWHDIPVVVISAMNDIASVARGIELGAEDYLSKPFDPVLLEARLKAGLEKKRLRDQEVEYLEQVERLTGAAQAVQSNTFQASSLDQVTQRPDALGNLARIFQRMAQEVHAREQRLQRQLQQLRLDVEEQEKAAKEILAAYVPMDRRHALAAGQELPDRTSGAVVFADISGFTPLTAALARELGRRRGAEELVRHLNRVYSALITEVHRYGGSVITFSGDSITCWFDRRSEPDLKQACLRATAAALAMQDRIRQFSSVEAAGTTINFAIKATVATGPVRRFLIGAPDSQKTEILAGYLLDQMAAGEKLANQGEVLLHETVTQAIGDSVNITGWKSDETLAESFALITETLETVPPLPWPTLEVGTLTPDQVRPWLLPAVFLQRQAGQNQFLSELRSATALFLHFHGPDYDEDDRAGIKLDRFYRWVQSIISRYEGNIIQVTTGDKGSYLYAAFGAPVAHDDDPVRAVSAALQLISLPEDLDFINDIQLGLASGQMRVGSYGSPDRQTYGILGNKTNLAARLMSAAAGSILCDETVYQATKDRFSYEVLSPITLKGQEEPVAAYRPLEVNIRSGTRTEHLVGRATEKALLASSLAEFKEGASRLIIIEGPAGMGKSRLVEDFCQQARAAGHPIYLGQGQQLKPVRSFAAWQPIFRRLLAIDESAAVEMQIGQLQSSLNRWPDLAELTPLLNPILSLNMPDNEITARISGPARTHKTHEMAVQLLQRLAPTPAGLFILEDAQWLDPASWALALAISRRIRPILLLLVTRPLAPPPDAYRQMKRSPRLAHLRLAGLPVGDLRRLVSDRLGGNSVPEPLVELLWQKTAGQPLFSQQLLDNLLDQGLLIADGIDCLLAPEADLDMAFSSQSVQDLIKNRIDSLPPGAQMVLKIASIIGREFDQRVLEALYPAEGQSQDLAGDLRLLESLGLIRRQSDEPTTRFKFTEALTQENVYGLMLFAQRRALHRTAAEWYEDTLESNQAQSFALLAHHWEQADDAGKAIHYLEKAGNEANRQGDSQGALRFFDRALALDANAAVLSERFNHSAE